MFIYFGMARSNTITITVLESPPPEQGKAIPLGLLLLGAVAAIGLVVYKFRGR